MRYCVSGRHRRHQHQTRPSKAQGHHGRHTTLVVHHRYRLLRNTITITIQRAAACRAPPFSRPMPVRPSIGTQW